MATMSIRPLEADGDEEPIDRILSVEIPVRVVMPRWPNFLRVHGRSEDAGQVDVADLSMSDVDELCADFQRHCKDRRERRG